MSNDEIETMLPSAPEENGDNDEEDNMTTKLYYFQTVHPAKLSKNEFRDYILGCLPYLERHSAKLLMTEDALDDDGFRFQMLHLALAQFHYVC